MLNVREGPMSDVTSRPWWRWRAGMRTACGLRVYAVRSAHPAGVREDDLRARPDVRALPYNARPNETDPATIGCLTQQARELWGAPVVARVVGVFADGSPEWAACDLPGRDPMYGYRSEFAALVAACDAAAGGSS